MVEINKKLNLVFQVPRDDGSVVHVHSTPISEAVFDRYFMTISTAYAAMIEKGSAWIASSAPRVAKKVLRRVAENEKTWEGPEGVQQGLLSEIRRLTQVMVNLGSGWEMLPLQDALDRGLFDPEDAEDVENNVCFFIVFIASTPKKDRDSVAGLFGEHLTPLSPTDWIDSLLTSKPVENTGEKGTQSFTLR